MFSVGMASKRKTPEDGFALPLPTEKKKRATAFDRCIICQRDLPGHLLRSGKSSSVTKLAQATRYSGNDVLLRICEDGSEIVDCLLWRDTCYASYTSQQNIKHSANATEPPKDQQMSKRVQRSDKDQIDWFKGFICKKRSYKKKTELINVSTFEACQSIKKAAKSNGDEDIMRLLIGIKDDLIAAEAKYHKN